jgi:hypothetical protein
MSQITRTGCLFLSVAPNFHRQYTTCQFIPMPCHSNPAQPDHRQIIENRNQRPSTTPLSIDGKIGSAFWLGMTAVQLARCRKRLEQFLVDRLEPIGRSQRRHWGAV